MLLSIFTSSSFLQRVLVVVALCVALLPMTALAEEEERWYNKSEWTFSWGERALASAVAVDIVTESGEEPFTVFNPPVESVTFGNGELQEGLQYFILQFKENDEWGEIFEQELRIDVTPPEMTMYIEYVEDGYPHLFVEAEDGLSGVEKYTILIDGDTDQQTLSPETVVAGYKLSMLSPGEHTVVVTAYDQAGNATALREHVTVRGSVTVGTFLNNVREHIARPAEVNVVAVAFLSLMAVFGICFGLVEHHAHKRARAEARREVLAMQNKISKVFSTLRRDVLMLTTMTSKKSRVTKKEKEAVEKVTKALSASEAVIEKK